MGYLKLPSVANVAAINCLIRTILLDTGFTQFLSFTAFSFSGLAMVLPFLLCLLQSRLFLILVVGEMLYFWTTTIRVGSLFSSDYSQQAAPFSDINWLSLRVRGKDKRRAFYFLWVNQ